MESKNFIIFLTFCVIIYFYLYYSYTFENKPYTIVNNQSDKIAINKDTLNLTFILKLNQTLFWLSCKKAISLNPLTIQDAMEWLIEHSEDPVDDAEEAKKPDDTIKNEETSSVAAAAASTSEIVPEAHSLKCDE